MKINDIDFEIKSLEITQGITLHAETTNNNYMKLEVDHSSQHHT